MTYLMKLTELKSQTDSRYSQLDALRAAWENGSVDLPITNDKTKRI